MNLKISVDCVDAYVGTLCALEHFMKHDLCNQRLDLKKVNAMREPDIGSADGACRWVVSPLFAAIQRGLGTTSPKRSSKGWYHTPCLLQLPNTKTRHHNKDQIEQHQAEHNERNNDPNDKNHQQNILHPMMHTFHFNLSHRLSNDKHRRNKRSRQSS